MKTTKSKQTYVNRWAGHIDELYALAFTNNREASKEIKEIIERLKVLLIAVADSKDLS